MKTALAVDRLDLDSIPRGSSGRLLVELAQDAVGRPISVPVMVARGRRPGPVLGLSAAIHGNELNGIPVIHRLLESINPAELRGTVVGIVVANVPALLAHQRVFPGGVDLNHVFPGRFDGNSPQSYAYRLLDRVISRVEVLLDLHTASAGRINSLYVRANMLDEHAARLAYLQRPDIIVHNPPSDRTLRGAVAAHGVPAITVEIGNPQRYQRDYIGRTLAGVRAVLGAHKMSKKRARKPSPDPVLCERSYWTYTDQGGLLEVRPGLTDVLAAGDVTAVQRNIFGDVVREYTSPESGVVVGRSVDPVSATGARVLHLGIPAGEDNAFQPRPGDT